MTTRTLTPEQTASLDFQVVQLFDSFGRAVETRSTPDAAWNRKLFTAYDESLSVAFSGSPYTHWKRNTQRAKIFDQYILPFTIGSSAANSLVYEAMGVIIPVKQTEFTADVLKQAVDDKKVSYFEIMNMARCLSGAKDFEGIVDALGYSIERD